MFGQRAALAEITDQGGGARELVRSSGDLASRWLRSRGTETASTYWLHVNKEGMKYHRSRQGARHEDRRARNGYVADLVTADVDDRREERT